MSNYLVLDTKTSVDTTIVNWRGYVINEPKCMLADHGLHRCVSLIQVTYTAPWQRADLPANSVPIILIMKP